MLATRIIPTLLMRGDKLVKGERFNPWRTVGVVEQAVRVHQSRGVDELILLNVDDPRYRRGPHVAAIERLTDCCFSPVTVGGGVRSVDDFNRLLRAGADKVAICTSESVVREAARRFGSQAVVAAIDVKDGVVHGSRGTVMMWSDPSTPLDPVRWAREIEGKGAGEILLTSIDREGTMTGYDLALIRAVASAVSIPVIAHGGCSGPKDMLAAIKAGASAVAAGALFQFTDWTPRACAEWLAREGIETRVPA